MVSHVMVDVMYKCVYECVCVCVCVCVHTTEVKKVPFFEVNKRGLREETPNLP